MTKISAVYKIVNEITGDSYIGSSKNVMSRWAQHKCPSIWKRKPNNPMYCGFQKYGIENFRFQILAPVEPEYLKQVEQEFIEMLNPGYNDRNAKGLDAERRIKSNRKYRQTEEGKESVRKGIKKYNQSEKGRKSQRKSQKKYYNRLCSYNGETLTLSTLTVRFLRAGIEHPTLEAKKYLI